MKSLVVVLAALVLAVSCAPSEVPASSNVETPTAGREAYAEWTKSAVIPWLGSVQVTYEALRAQPETPSLSGICAVPIEDVSDMRRQIASLQAPPTYERLHATLVEMLYEWQGLHDDMEQLCEKPSSALIDRVVSHLDRFNTLTRVANAELREHGF